jgi:nucleoside 2-deoxyribosyltransferase
MKRVVISGSLKYENEMKEFASVLESNGFTVKYPANKVDEDFVDLKEKYKRLIVEGLAYNYYQGIRTADVLFVYNKEGYAGCSTTLELGYALSVGIPIYALEEDLEVARDVLYESYCKTPDELIERLQGKIF